MQEQEKTHNILGVQIESLFKYRTCFFFSRTCFRKNFWKSDLLSQLLQASRFEGKEDLNLLLCIVLIFFLQESYYFLKIKITYWLKITTYAFNEILSESEVAQSCLTLWDSVDCSLPGSSVHGILQARILEWVALSFSRGASQSRDWTWVSHIAGRCSTLWATREAQWNIK